MLVVQRGNERESYWCNPICMPTVQLGDENKAFTDASGQISARNALAQGGAAEIRRAARRTAPRSAMRRLILEEPVSRAAVWSRRTAIFALADRRRRDRAVAVRPASSAAAALTVFGAALMLAFLAVLLAGAAGGGHLAHRPARRRSGRARLGVLSLALLAYPAYLAAIGAAAADDRPT